MKRLTLIALVLLVAGCASDGSGPPEPAPLPELDVRTMVGKILWASDTGAGSGNRVTGFKLAVDGRKVYAANPDGVVTALDLETGGVVWQTDTRFRLVSGPTAAGGMLFLGTRDGRVVALSASDGSLVWQARVGSEVLAAPAAGNGTVVVHTLAGNLVAFDLQDGDKRWVVSRSVPTLTVRGLSSPEIVGDTVYAGLDNGKVLALELSTGAQIWQQRVAVPSGQSELEQIVDIDAELLPLEERIYAASVGGAVAALAKSNGRIIWKRDVAVRSGLTFDRNQIFATSVDGSVYSFARSSGVVLWEQDALAYRRLTAPVMYRGYVMVAGKNGYLHWMIPEDGTIVGRVQVVEGVRTPPVVIGERILVLGTEGTVVALKGVRPES